MPKVKFDRLKVKLPEVQDEVKHKKQKDYIGIVIAKYPLMMPVEDGDSVEKIFLDVQISPTNIKYTTPAENWETLRTEEERFK